MSDKETKLETLETINGESAEDSKLDNLSFADGREEDAIQKARELEELVGLKEVNPYGTSIGSVFEENLQGLALVDLQELAAKVGVFPSGTKTNLKKKLMKAFRDYQRGSSSFVIPQSSSSICEQADKNSPEFKKALELMQEGL